MENTSFTWFWSLVAAVLLASVATVVLVVVTRLRVAVPVRILRRLVLLPADPEGEAPAQLLAR